MTFDLKKDLEECDKFLEQAKGGHVKQALVDLKSKLTFLIEQEKFKEAAQSTPSHPNASSLRPTIKLATYAYDESENYVKLYYTLNGVQNLDASKVKSTFTDDSFDVTITDLDGKDYTISAKGFTHPIDATKSVVKQKSDMLLVMMKKAESGTWSELLKIVHAKKEEQKLKDDAAMGDTADPQAGMMNMMKKLYEDGDDEMKRSLKKAWFESQNKKQGGGEGGFGGFPGGDLGGLSGLGMDM